MTTQAIRDDQKAALGSVACFTFIATFAILQISTFGVRGLVSFPFLGLHVVGMFAFPLTAGVIAYTTNKIAERMFGRTGTAAVQIGLIVLVVILTRLAFAWTLGRP